MKGRLKTIGVLLFIAACGIGALVFRGIPGDSRALTEELVSSVSISLEEDAESSVITEKTDEISSASVQEEVPETKDLYVHVCGAVKHEGVYRLQEGDRVADAIAAAGGLRKTAAGYAVNQAALLSDGVKIYIPTEEEAEQGFGDSFAAAEETVPEAGTGTAAQASEVQTLIDLNTATLAELMTLPGIGEKKAQSILDYRDQCGGFKDVGDLTSVSGIGDATVQKLAPFVTVH